MTETSNPTDPEDDDPRTATPAWEVEHETTQMYETADPGMETRLSGYPVGRWFITDRRQTPAVGEPTVLYQRVRVDEGSLVLEDWWRESATVDDDEEPRKALAAMPEYRRRWPTIASHPRPKERPALRRELRMWCLYFIDAAAPASAVTLSKLTAAMWEHPANKWAQSDIRSMFAQTQEMGLWTVAADLNGGTGPTLTVDGQERVARGDISDMFHPDDRDPFVAGDAA